MAMVIIASIIIGIIFSAFGHAVGFGCPNEQWLWDFISFFLASLFSYGVLFHIFLKQVLTNH